jgi:glyoxylase-like metal-dependent hydrolase (beta-lactamase superfamily II)
VTFRVSGRPDEGDRSAGSDAAAGGQGLVFTGDTLFNGSVGRTDLPGGSGRDLIDSIMSRLMVLDDDTRVLPGHGEASTIGVERRTNPFLQGLVL